MFTNKKIFQIFQISKKKKFYKKQLFTKTKHFLDIDKTMFVLRNGQTVKVFRKHTETKLVESIKIKNKFFPKSFLPKDKKTFFQKKKFFSKKKIPETKFSKKKLITNKKKCFHKKTYKTKHFNNCLQKWSN